MHSGEGLDASAPSVLGYRIPAPPSTRTTMVLPCNPTCATAGQGFCSVDEEGCTQWLKPRNMMQHPTHWPSHTQNTKRPASSCTIMYINLVHNALLPHHCLHVPGCPILRDSRRSLIHHTRQPKLLPDRGPFSARWDAPLGQMCHWRPEFHPSDMAIPQHRISVLLSDVAIGLAGKARPQSKGARYAPPGSVHRAGWLSTSGGSGVGTYHETSCTPPQAGTGMHGHLPASEGQGVRGPSMCLEGGGISSMCPKEHVDGSRGGQ